MGDEEPTEEPAAAEEAAAAPPDAEAAAEPAAEGEAAAEEPAAEAVAAEPEDEAPPVAEEPAAEEGAAEEGGADEPPAEGAAEPAAEAEAEAAAADGAGEGAAEGAAEGEAAEGAAEGDAAAAGDAVSSQEVAATRIAAIQRGKKARAEVVARREALEEEEYDDMDGLDGGVGLGDDEDEDDFDEGGEAYGDFDMLEGAEADGIEENEEMEDDRANLAELYQQAHEEKAAFLELNQTLQRKLVDYLRTVKKNEENKEAEKSVTDQEQRYFKCLAQVNELRDELKRLQQQYDRTAMEMKKRLDDKEFKAREIKEAFMEFKREILKGAENSRTGKPIPLKLIKSFEEQEGSKDTEVEKLRLTNINRRNVLRKLEQTLRQKEKLADGLHLIDFEQLKIENQTLNEKIEERNEELLKLRKKTTTTVQVLTHLKEKLQFVQAENQVLKHDLADLEIELTNKRDVLTQTKHERDSLRAENTARRQQRGLVSSEDLLLDFEKRRQDILAKKEDVLALQNRHQFLLKQAADAKQQVVAAGGQL